MTAGGTTVCARATRATPVVMDHARAAAVKKKRGRRDK
jgi:hypothetical protein